MEKDAIFKPLADNPILLEALRELLMSQFALPKTVLEPTTSDVLLGQHTRLHIGGIAAIEAAFREISKYKTQPKSETEGINQAR